QRSVGIGQLQVRQRQRILVRCGDSLWPPTKEKTGGLPFGFRQGKKFRPCTNSKTRKNLKTQVPRRSGASWKANLGYPAEKKDAGLRRPALQPLEAEIRARES